MIPDLVRRFWSKGKALSRLDFQKFYKEFGYPTPFIERNKETLGVAELYEELKKAHDSFREKHQKVVNAEVSKEKRLFWAWRVFRILKIIGKRLFLICATAVIVAFIFSIYNRFKYAELSNSILLVALLVAPWQFLFKALEKIIEITYQKNSIRIQEALVVIIDEYLSVENECGKKMDNLCLASLIPHERSRELQHRKLIAMKEREAKLLEAKRNL